MQIRRKEKMPMQSRKAGRKEYRKKYRRDA